MTRGKYTRTAPVRRANDQLETDVATYQRKVADLTAEVSDLKQRLNDQEQQRNAQVRELTAQRRAGVAPELAARDRKIAELTSTVDRLRVGIQKSQDRWDKLTSRILGHLTEADGATKTEAMEVLLGWLGGKEGAVFVWDEKFPGMSTERIKMLQRKRGDRRA